MQLFLDNMCHDGCPLLAQRFEANTICPVQRSNEMNERHLKLKSCGFPLWILQPNLNIRPKVMSVSSQRSVILIITYVERSMTQSSLKNFLITSLNPTDVREIREFGSGSYLASLSIIESQTGEHRVFVLLFYYSCFSYYITGDLLLSPRPLKVLL